jgi:hypothetical protein|uniref:Uncharacterized protein n=1 Tax=Sipha flava TaxID=143950 RepID=A0A2S2QAE1_9HEMI
MTDEDGTTEGGVRGTDEKFLRGIFSYTRVYLCVDAHDNAFSEAVFNYVVRVHTIILHTYHCNVYITITRHLIGWAKSREHERTPPVDDVINIRVCDGRVFVAVVGGDYVRIDLPILVLQ